MAVEMKHCHACGAEVEIVTRVGRRDTCDACSADLHCCKNCRHHDPFAQNQCREPAADVVVRDRDSANFCDFFDFRDGKTEKDPVAEAKAKLEALFRK